MTLPGTNFDMDDKDVAMICILLICSLSMWISKDVSLARDGIIAIAAFATGRKTV